MWTRGSRSWATTTSTSVCHCHPLRNLCTAVRVTLCLSPMPSRTLTPIRADDCWSGGRYPNGTQYTELDKFPSGTLCVASTPGCSPSGPAPFSAVPQGPLLPAVSASFPLCVLAASPWLTTCTRRAFSLAPTPTEAPRRAPVAPERSATRSLTPTPTRRGVLTTWYARTVRSGAGPGWQLLRRRWRFLCPSPASSCSGDCPCRRKIRATPRETMQPPSRTVRFRPATCDLRGEAPCTCVVGQQAAPPASRSPGVWGCRR